MSAGTGLLTCIPVTVDFSIDIVSLVVQLSQEPVDQFQRFPATLAVSPVSRSMPMSQVTDGLRQL